MNAGGVGAHVAPAATITYDPDLPISAFRDQIAQTIADHQVVVIAGETGSGKTTQLPKICLELGRSSIAHTQPRRIAARSVAERIAEELHVELGELVGYQVRFTRKAGRDTRLKIMTDGVLLAEIAHDRELRRYDTIIIDEAHERSLNIDFLLGYLRRLSFRRPDLKIIITSATIDTERFSAHFAGTDGIGAPIIEVSGRTYPVEIRYRPLLADGEADQTAGICAAVTELSALGSGDILVFCSGERDIRDAADAIAGMQLRFTEVVPLYARLSAAEQHRVFTGHTGRRIVLATNVAETSLTVPGIRYVIDTGTARISRYSARTKVQRLPIEPISQASANQRAGRCGRVAPGVCVRLYDEEDFLGRPEFTEPEILRTNLASVILQMTAADLGDIADFPFVEAPDRTQITDGLRLLDELGALAGEPRGDRVRLTGIGRRLAQLPVDPRMGRMLLAGERQGALRELLIIVAALSVQDPRERPAEHREQAEALHRRFWSPLPSAADQDQPAADAPPEGDFVALLRLWDYVRDRQRELSGNAFRRLCRDEFLHLLRIREWQDLHAQLRQITRDLGLHRNEMPAASDRVHTAVLAGLLSQVGLADLKQDEEKTRGRRTRRPLREYSGARGTRFAINPGSSLARTQPPLVMAAEIVETTRLWARTVAAIDAAQIEEVGAHLLKRSYAEPHWSARQGSVMAYETVTLLGVPIIARRQVGYGRIQPAEAREIFIRSALVEGLWRTRHHFFRDNTRVREEAEQLEERTRRRDLVVDDQVIFDFYAARIPAEVTGGVQFDTWWKKARHVTPDLLTLTVDDLVTREVSAADAFPDHWVVGEHELPVGYRFEPTSDRDGVSVQVPVALLNQIPADPFSWQVPGLRNELAAELLRSLPKSLRRELVPAPDVAARALVWLGTQTFPEPVEGKAKETMPSALARAVRALTGVLIPDDAWNLAAVPAHLRITFVITDERGTEIDHGKDLDELRRRAAPQTEAVLSRAAAELLRTGATDWDFGDLEDQLALRRGGHQVIGYPALVDEQTSVGLAVLASPVEQQRSQVRGLRRLTVLQTPDPTRWVVSHLSMTNKLALAAGPYEGVPALLADARLASVGELVRRQQHAGERVRSEAQFRRLVDAVRVDNADLMRAIVDLAAEVIIAEQHLRADLPRLDRAATATAEDVTEQIGNLVFPGFLAATPYEHLVDLPRYLRAAQQRVTTALASPGRDRAGLEVITECETAYAELCDKQPAGPLPDHVAEIGWLLEELRVSLFAQQLRTKVPVSAKRVQSAIRSAQVD